MASEFTGTVAASFSASHVVKGHPNCGRVHGHLWRCEVTIKAGQDPATGDLVGLPELAQAVQRFCSELDLEDVNAMFPASQPTAAGVALALRERLSLQFRTIEVVQVWMGDVSSILHA
jgi:6-pyruvoyltetrahydropterin/6-carboxytetrahydropterin synthase